MYDRSWRKEMGVRRFFRFKKPRNLIEITPRRPIVDATGYNKVRIWK
jgi:hypothetical protein